MGNRRSTASTAGAAELVDVIFLDIDGVLLPFGCDETNETPRRSAPGCLFPLEQMDALASLLDRAGRLSVGADREPAARGNPVLVLSSTWRVRPDFVDDIVSSFEAHAAHRGRGGGTTAWTTAGSPGGGPFFDMTDPLFQSTRCEEVYKWVGDNAGLVAGRTDGGGGPAREFRVRSWIGKFPRLWVSLLHTALTPLLH